MMVPILKDEDQQQPVASIWRLTLKAIVDAIASGNVALEGIPSVPAITPTTTQQIVDYLASYGETLAELPNETWTSSVSQWMGHCWVVLVDLWTVESERSDMVLSVRVFEDNDGFRFDVGGVYVP